MSRSIKKLLVAAIYLALATATGWGAKDKPGAWCIYPDGSEELIGDDRTGTGPDPYTSLHEALGYSGTLLYPGPLDSDIAYWQNYNPAPAGTIIELRGPGTWQIAGDGAQGGAGREKQKSFVVQQDGITIRGQDYDDGNGNIVQQKIYSASGATTPIFYLEASNLTIQNLNISGLNGGMYAFAVGRYTMIGTDRNAAGLTLSGCTINGVQGMFDCSSKVDLSGSEPVSLIDATISNNGVTNTTYNMFKQYGVNFAGGCAITGNTFENVGTDKAYPMLDIVDNQGTLRIDGNTFTTWAANQYAVLVRADVSAHPISLWPNTFTDQLGGSGAPYQLIPLASGGNAIGGQNAGSIVVEPSTVWVDDDYTQENCGGHTWNENAFTSIQAGVNAAGIGGTVNIAAGTYRENVTINKALSLLGAKAGVDPRSGARTAGSAEETIIDGRDVSGTIARTGCIVVQGADAARVTGLVIDGLELCHVSGEPLVLEYVDNSTIKNLIVHHSSSNEGIKTRAACSGLLIQKVVSFENMGDGIELGGYGTNKDHIIEDSWFYNNDDRGIYNDGCENTTIRRVKCFGNRNTLGNDWHQGGITSYQSAGTIITDAECYDNNGPGIYLYEENYTGALSSKVEGNTKCYNNENNGAIPGEGVKVYLANRVAISGVESYGNGRHGISAGCVGRDGDYSASDSCTLVTITDCNVHDNTSSGIAFLGTNVTETAGTRNCSATGNTLSGNTQWGVSNGTPGIVSAINNYWGAADGPSGAGPGSGDAVSANVAFSPWWADEAMTQLRYSENSVVTESLTIGTGVTTNFPGRMTVAPGTTITVDNGSLQAGSIQLEAGASISVINGKLTITGQNGEPTVMAGTFTIFDSWGSIYINADLELSGDTIALVSHLVFANGVELAVSGSLVLDGCVLEGAADGDSYSVIVSNSASLQMARNEVFDCSSFTVDTGDAVVKDNFFADGLTVGVNADGAQVFHNIFADVLDLVDNGANSVLDADGWGNISTNDATLNNLGLVLAGSDGNGDIYIQPGDAISVSMDIDALDVPVSGCDALLGFNTRFLGGTGDVSVIAGAAPWTFNIYESIGLDGVYGQINESIGVDLTAPLEGTTNDATVISFEFVTTAEEGVTKMYFHLPEAGSIPSDTQLVSAPDGNPVYVSPFTMNSGYITIDGTAPLTESFIGLQTQESDDVDVFDPANLTQQGVVLIGIDATDELSGLAGAALSVVHQADAGITLSPTLITTHTNGEMATSYGWAVIVDAATSNGIYDVQSIVTDRSGNATTNDAAIEVYKPEIEITVELAGATATAFDRDVVFAMTDAGGALIEARTNTLSFSGTVATLTMKQIPVGVAALSADTDWTLRSRQALVFDADGQAAVDFVLTGGDITGENLVNLLDYGRLRYYMNTPSPEADISGDGFVNLIDYGVLRAAWYQSGDDE